MSNGTFSRTHRAARGLYCVRIIVCIVVIQTQYDFFYHINYTLQYNNKYVYKYNTIPVATVTFVEQLSQVLIRSIYNA